MNYWLLQAEKEQLEKDIESHLLAKIAAGGSMSDLKSYVVDYLRKQQKTQFQVHLVVDLKSKKILVTVT